MSEISIVLVNLVALSIAYLYIYPKFSGNDIKKLAWLDTAVGAAALVVIAPFAWNSSNDYTFVSFETSWWIFGVLTYALLEVPLFFLYVKARGLGGQYRTLWKSNGFTQTASKKQVDKQLSDTKWDGLRTQGALRFLVLGANATTIVGTIFLFNVGDNLWASLLILYFLILSIFWFLLRTSVRLIPDAPDEALDERLIQERNGIYVLAYQFLAGGSCAIATALFGYAVSQDLLNQGEAFDGFNYQINLTWPQINAIFWLVFGYAYMLPSMIMAWRESTRLRMLKMNRKGSMVS